ncbi:hypothetical protein [Virgibacillus profundi]|uniref:hypothetical protein n=1 Tax=Virgibacillus profundi TaxID=2024555 RepID=UPI0013FDD44A|nr:hypothetical protein [Virgibacillus profundi]
MIKKQKKVYIAYSNEQKKKIFGQKGKALFLLKRPKSGPKNKYKRSTSNFS